MTTVYDFSARLLNGEDVSLSRWQGRVLLIVNTASACGFTPQYAGLEDLYEEFGDDGRQLVGREGQRRRDLQEPVRRAALPADLVLQGLDLAHDTPRRGVEGLALLGEADCPGRALQQPHAEPGFQPGHQLADRRRGQAETRRGG